VTVVKNFAIPISYLHAVFTRTVNFAQFSFRKGNNDDLVLLGEVNEYEPLSRAAFYKAMGSEEAQNKRVNRPAAVNSKNKKT
jgi:thymidine kinase